MMSPTLPTASRPHVKPLRTRLLGALTALVLLPATGHALDTSPWPQRQDFVLNNAGLVKLALPADLLDPARPDLADLRVLDAAGRETPYALTRPVDPQPAPTAPLHFRAELAETSTVLTLETGTTLPLAAVTVATPARDFIKSARVELSSDGLAWQTIAEGLPLFIQSDASRLTLSLPHRPAAWVRISLDDRRSPPIAFTGATLLVGEARPAPTEPVAIRITARDELPGETVLTLDLGANHLPLTSLGFESTDPLFTRTVSVTRREFQDAAVIERPLARGTIYRIALEGLAPAERLALPLNLTAAPRELIVHISNGDSPPLKLTGLNATRQPVWIVFNAASPGAYTLLAGQPQASSPRYDLPVLATDFDRLPVTAATFGKPVPNPGYVRPEALANVDLEGAQLDPQGWAWRKPVLLTASGVQQLELDLDVLAQASPDLADLRLLRDGRQLPYLIERTSLVRSLALSPLAADDPKQPLLSRWQLKLPRSGLPITRITASSSNGLFQRHLRLYEIFTDNRGYTREITLASADWTRSPAYPGKALSLVLSTPPRADTLWMETDNGDNAPLTLTGLQAWHPVTRLLFKAAASDHVALYYGRPQTEAPRYDADLVAGQFFTAEKNTAKPGTAEDLASRRWKSTTFISGRSGALFWGAIVFVSALLLTIVVRLLPKPPST